MVSLHVIEERTRITRHATATTIIEDMTPGLLLLLQFPNDNNNNTSDWELYQ
jgi:hypothetical protein